MTSGFRTVTDDGVLQIDQQFKTYQLIRKVKVVCTGGSSGAARGDYSFRHEGHILVAARNSISGQPWFIIGTRLDPNNVWSIGIGAPNNHTVELFIFSYANIVKARHGLNIYADDGTPVFSSAVPYMNIKEFYQIPGKGMTVNNLPEGNYALVPPAFSSYVSWRPPFYMMMFCNGYSVNSNGFKVAQTLWFERPAGTDPVNDGALVDGVGMLIDVNNCEDVVWS